MIEFLSMFSISDVLLIASVGGICWAMIPLLHEVTEIEKDVDKK